MATRGRPWTRRALSAGLAIVSGTAVLGLPASAGWRRPPDGLEAVVRHLESTRTCQMLRLVGWREAACAEPDLPAPADVLARDLTALVWRAPDAAVPRLPWWHAWPALRCQVALAHRVEDAVRHAARGGDARRGRGPRRRFGAHGRRRDLSRVCDVRVVGTPELQALPRVGRQCAAAVGAPGSRVEPASLGQCVDTLVATWVARHFPVAGSPTRRRPNLIVILADDQRADAIGRDHPLDPAGAIPAMPATVDRLADEGVVFRNAFASSAVCGPSRAALFTGQYAHGNGVFNNEGIRGGWFFDDRDTVANWLQQAGYRTGFFGKYMNQYSLRWASPLRSPVAPPGWDDWRAFDHPTSVPHFAFRLAVDGGIVRYSPTDYSTDVLAEHALDFVDEAADDDRPFLLWFSAATPHFPWTPAPRHRGAFANSPPSEPPSLFEQDVSDKPAWVATLPEGSPLRRLAAERTRRAQLEMQRSVDEFVAALMERLDALGLSDDTAIVYTSDNGQAWGEHRWLSKGCPWEECVRVPLVVRYPRLAPLARVDDSLMSLVDLPVTLAALAGAPMPAQRDGRPRVLALDGTESSPPESVLIESYIAPRLTWVALRESRHKLIVYQNGESELYDLETDPFELESLADDPDQRDRIDAMRARIDALWPGWAPIASS